MLDKSFVGSGATKNDGMCWGREQVKQELKSSLNQLRVIERVTEGLKSQTAEFLVGRMRSSHREAVGTHFRGLTIKAAST